MGIYISSFFRPTWACFLCRIRGSRERLQSLGLEHHPFHQTLLTKAHHKASPDSRFGETDSISSWEDLQIRIAKSMGTREANDMGHPCSRPTTRCNHQIDEKC